MKKLMEVFVPPGVVKIEKTYDREHMKNWEIKNAVPKDTIAIRKKTESRSTMRGGKKGYSLQQDESRMAKNLSTKTSTGGKKEENQQRDAEARAKA